MFGIPFLKRYHMSHGISNFNGTRMPVDDFVSNIPPSSYQPEILEIGFLVTGYSSNPHYWSSDNFIKEQFHRKKVKNVIDIR